MKRIIAIMLAVFLTGTLTLPATAATEPEIVRQIQSPTFRTYGDATYEITAYGYNLYCTWYLIFQGKFYNLSDTSVGVQDWEPYAGETYGDLEPEVNGAFTTFRYVFRGIGPELDGAFIYAVITNGHNEITGNNAVIRLAEDVGTPPTVMVSSDVEAFQGEPLELHCQAADPMGGTLRYVWYESYGRDMDTIVPLDDGSHTGATLQCDTSDPGTRYYVCAVETSNGGRAYSSAIRVTVLEKSPISIVYTADSVADVGHTLTVDIMAMMDADARIWNAVFEGTVQYQWYKDGTAIADATTTSLELDESYEGSLVHVVVRCDNLVLRGAPFQIAAQLPPFEITTPTLPDGQVGEPYQAQLQSNDPKTVYQLFAEADNQVFEQMGLRLEADGTVSGTPTKAGTYTFTVFASCERGTHQKTYTLTISEAKSEEPTESDPPSEPTPGEPTEPTPAEKSDDPKETTPNQPPLWSYAVIGVIALGIVIAVFFALKKRT